MDIIEIVKADYQRFPENQTYTIYAEEVYFRDPLTEFRGIKRYRAMIQTLKTWLKEIHLDLKEIRQQDNIIYSQWTLFWTTPVPWQPRISIPGHSELTLNEENLIISHIDYWDCSRRNVIQQHFLPKSVKIPHNK